MSANQSKVACSAALDANVGTEVEQERPQGESQNPRIDLADDFSRLKPIVQSNTNCTLKTHLMPLDLIGALFCHPRLKPNGKHRMAEWNQHPNTKSHHDHDFKYMK